MKAPRDEEVNRYRRRCQCMDIGMNKVNKYWTRGLDITATLIDNHLCQKKLKVLNSILFFTNDYTDNKEKNID